MRLLFVPVIVAMLCACSTQEVVIAHSVPLSTTPVGTYSESELLDVGIVIFEAGVPLGDIDKQVLEELMRDVPWDDYYGPGSPLERFHRRGGRVLRLGASIETVTLLHYAEYMVPLAEKRRTRRHRRVRRGDGTLTTVHVDCLDDEHGIVDYPDGDYFGSLLRDYLATGRSRAGTVGRAHSELIEAPDLLEFAVQWMAEKLAPRT